MRYRTRPRTAYLAARFERKVELQAAEMILQQHNIEPGTRWLHNETDMRLSPDEDRRKFANWNVEDVLNADMLIIFSEDLSLAATGSVASGGPIRGPHVDDPDGVYVPAIWARGGRHVEFGIAIGQGISVAVIGPKENLFHYYDPRPEGHTDPDNALIVHFDNLEAFVKWYDEHNVLPEDAEMPNNETRPSE